MSPSDKTSVSLLNQSLQFALDEMDLKNWYDEDLKDVEKSQRNIKEQDKLAEESFKKLFDFDTKKIQSKRFSNLADEYIKGDYSIEEKKDIFKNRLYDIWSSLGKPIFDISDTFGSKYTKNLRSKNDPKYRRVVAGLWNAQDKRDFITPYRMKNIETKSSFNINDLFKIESLSDKYERRYGGKESYDDWYTSNKYRKDLIKIRDKKTIDRIWTAMEELTHQMQGRQLIGDDVTKIRNEAFRQRFIPERYSNTKTIEHHAHTTLGDVIKSAMKGDKKALDIIKSRTYNNYFE